MPLPFSISQNPAKDQALAVLPPVEALNIQKKSIVQEVAQIKEADMYFNLSKYLVTTFYHFIVINY